MTSNNQNIIGIDFGTKRIGIAICDPSFSFALPLTVINNDAKTLNEIQQIVDEEKVGLIVLGFPKTQNNYVSERHQLILDFKKDLEDYLKNIKIVLQDESYSTKGSYDSMISLGSSKKSYQKNKDMVSACIILESYLKYGKDQRR